MSNGAQFEWPRGGGAREPGRKGTASKRTHCSGTGSIGIGNWGLPVPIGGLGPAVQEVQAAVHVGSLPASAPQDGMTVRRHGSALLAPRLRILRTRPNPRLCSPASFSTRRRHPPATKPVPGCEAAEVTHVPS
jgi:hypothetical protein